MNEPPKQSDGLKQAVTFEDQRITIISDIDLTIKENQRQRLTAFATILCTSGSCELSVNSRDFTLTAGSMLVCTPGDTIEGHSSTPDFNAVGFYLSKEFLDELSSMPLGLVNARVYIQEPAPPHQRQRTSCQRLSAILQPHPLKTLRSPSRKTPQTRNRPTVASLHV